MKAGWKIKPLGELCQVIGGGTPQKDRPDYYGGTIPWATVRDMRTDIISSTEHSITPEAVKASATNIIPAGNVVIATRVGLGKVCLLSQNTAINQDLRGIVPKSNKEIDVAFLFAWFKSISEQIISEGTGATVQGVKLPFVKELAVPIPPIEEQRRIVTLLDEAFADIATAKANAEKNLQNARELANELSAQILSAPSANCTIQSLEEIVEADCSLSYGIVQPGDEFESGLPIVRPVNLDRPLIELGGLKRIDPTLAKGYERTKLKGGEVLLCVRGTTGTLSCASSALAGANVTRGIVPIRFNPQSVSQELGYFLMRSAPVQAQIRAKTYGTALMQINIRDLRQIQIPVPHPSQQAAIAKALQDAEEQTNRLTEIQGQKLTALEDLKKSLLHHAFSGQLSQ